MREGEAADEDGPRRRRAGRIVGELVGDRRAPELTRPPGHLGKALGPVRLEDDGLAERRKDEAVAIGLLQAGKAISGPPRAENGGTQVELCRNGRRDSHDERTAAAPRRRNCPVYALPQPLLRGGRERKRIIRARDLDCHARKDD